MCLANWSRSLVVSTSYGCLLSAEPEQPSSMQCEVHAKVPVVVMLVMVPFALHIPKAVSTAGCKEDSMDMAVLPRHNVQQCAK